MATFRSNFARLRLAHAVLPGPPPAGILLFVVLFSLACMPVEEARIQKIEIEHVNPARDAVGPQPKVLEWTAAAGVDSYSLAVENEIEIQMFELDNITSTSVPWPKEAKLEPGTYFWRIIGVKGDRIIADSGRAAFVILERPSASLRPAPSAVEGR